jgi:hypothetical protein
VAVWAPGAGAAWAAASGPVSALASACRAVWRAAVRVPRNGVLPAPGATGGPVPSERGRGLAW